MSVLALEVRPEDLTLDEALNPDSDNRIVYEHLLYHTSKVGAIGAVGVKIENGKLQVIRNHKYLKIAKELGLTPIRAFVENRSLEESRQEVYTDFSNARIVEPSEFETERMLSPYSMHWYIFFFRTCLTINDRAVFQEKMSSFFASFKAKIDPPFTDLAFPFEGRCAEFRACTPMFDRTWMPEFITVVKDFSSQHVKIVSFDGRLFE